MWEVLKRPDDVGATIADGASGMVWDRLVDIVVPGQARLLRSAGRVPAKYAGILVGLQPESQHPWQAPFMDFGESAPYDTWRVYQLMPVTAVACIILWGA